MQLVPPQRTNLNTISPLSIEYEISTTTLEAFINKLKSISINNISQYQCVFTKRKVKAKVTKFCVGREELINVYKLTKFDLYIVNGLWGTKLNAGWTDRWTVCANSKIPEHICTFSILLEKIGRHTGKPVYNGHSRDWRYLSVIDRCPLKPGYHYCALLIRFEYLYCVSKKAEVSVCFVFVNAFCKFTNQCKMYVQVIQYLCKADKIHLKLLKCSIQTLPKFLLCFLKCHWLEIFCFELANSRHPLPLATKFISSTLLSMTSSVSTPYFIQNQLKFTQFSISNTTGHLNTHVIIVNVYRSICISKQSLSTNVPVCIHVELIGQLPA